MDHAGSNAAMKTAEASASAAKATCSKADADLHRLIGDALITSPLPKLQSRAFKTGSQSRRK